MMQQALIVFIGGGLGSLFRFGIAELLRVNFRSGFPLSTLLANLLSCILLGLALYIFSFKTDGAAKLFIVVGVCGGFSTFSTFSFETFELFRNGNALLAVLNIFISIVFCLGIIYFFSRQVNA